MSNFVLDTFTDGPSLSLVFHNPELGGPIAESSGETIGAAQITAAGRLRSSNNFGVPIGYYYAAAPVSADYDVMCDLYFATVETVAWGFGVRGRIQTSAETYYQVRAVYDPADANNIETSVELSKLVAGTFTRLAVVNYAFTAGKTYRIKLMMRGTMLTAWISTNAGSSYQPLMNVVDASIPNAGFAGLGGINNGVLSDAAGCQIDNFTAANAPLPLTAFAADSFTDTAGTVLGSHTPDLGGSATEIVAGYAGATATITAAGRLRPTVSSNQNWYLYPDTPASADYDVVSDVYIASTDVNNIAAGVIGRATSGGNCYQARIRGLSSGTPFSFGVDLYLITAATNFSYFGGASLGSPVAGTTYKIKLSMRGSTISAWYSTNGGATWTQACSTTDSTLTAAGNAGVSLISASNTSDTVGYQLDNFYAAAPVTILPNDATWTSSPGNWALNSSNGKTTDEGAKRTIVVSGTSFATLNFNVAGFSSYPTIRISVDDGAVNDVTVAAAVSAFSGLPVGAHKIVYEYLRDDYTVDCWAGPTMNVCETGLSLDTTAHVYPAADTFTDQMIVAGDSIVRGIFMLSTSQPGGQDATATFCKALGQALSAEVGVIGKGGIGWAWPDVVPAFPASWNYQWNGQPRSFGTLKRFVVVLGTNDALNGVLDTAVVSAITSWIAAARSALGATPIYIVIPIGGFKRNAITTAVATAGDPRTTLIDLGTVLQNGLTGPQGTPTRQSISDGIHPGVITHGQMGAAVAAAIRSVESSSSLTLHPINNVGGGILAGL